MEESPYMFTLADQMIPHRFSIGSFVSLLHSAHIFLGCFPILFVSLDNNHQNGDAEMKVVSFQICDLHNDNGSFHGMWNAQKFLIIQRQLTPLIKRCVELV